MKKLFMTIAISIIAITSASAFQLGVQSGASFGMVSSPLGDALGGSSEPEKSFSWCPDFIITIPHHYGDSNWFGQAELGFMGSTFHSAYNVGYSISLGDKFFLSPFAGAVIPLGAGFGMAAGVNARFPLGIGDLTADIRYIPTFGLLIRRQWVSVTVGYTFRFGKDRL